MKLSNFAISATEAVLLGDCLGESVSRPGRSFLSVIRSRFSAVIVDFGFLSSRWFDRRNATDSQEIHWITPMQRMIGVSPQHPWTFYECPGKSGRVGWEMRWDASRKSLIDLLFVHCGEFLELSEIERVIYHFGAAPQANPDWRDVTAFFADTDSRQEDLLDFASKDDSALLENFLVELAADNDVLQFFETGRLFGESKAMLEDFNEQLGVPMSAQESYEFPEGPKPDVASESDVAFPCERQMSQLAENFLVKNRPFACGLLSSLKDSWLEWVKWPGSDEDSFEPFSLEPLWLAYGEILGSLRAVDAELEATRGQDFYDRVFSTGKNMDDLRSSIRKAKLLTQNPDFTPEDALRLVSWGVEFLMTECGWKTSRNSWVSMKLDELPSTGGPSANFASIAKPIWKLYRHPLSHGRRGCSFAEANYVINAMEALCELTDQIKSELGNEGD